jgi:hypothetical protein
MFAIRAAAGDFFSKLYRSNRLSTLRGGRSSLLFRLRPLLASPAVNCPVTVLLFACIMFLLLGSLLVLLLLLPFASLALLFLGHDPLELRP